MPIKIKLTEEQRKFFKENANLVSFGAGNDKESFMYFPYWIKMDDSEEVELLGFHELPKELVDFIKNKRERGIELPTKEELLLRSSIVVKK